MREINRKEEVYFVNKKLDNNLCVLGDYLRALAVNKEFNRKARQECAKNAG